MATTLREARLIKYFIKQDVFYPWRRWPAWLQEMALLEHKTHTQRFKLFQFFTFNGLEPWTAYDWTLARTADPRGDTLYLGVYDASAHRSLKNDWKKAYSGELYRNAKLLDMNVGYVVDATGHRVNRW